MIKFTPFNGPVWRLLPNQYASNPAIPAQSPTGRFHHAGQIAAYASLSAEGTQIAIKRYLTDNIPRTLIAMHFKCSRVADMRNQPAASIIWQAIHAATGSSPTWASSDAARTAGAAAMLYKSRSRHDITHIVIFDTKLLTRAK